MTLYPVVVMIGLDHGDLDEVPCVEKLQYIGDKLALSTHIFFATATLPQQVGLLFRGILEYYVRMIDKPLALLDVNDVPYFLSGYVTTLSAPNVWFLCRVIFCHHSAQLGASTLASRGAAV